MTSFYIKMIYDFMFNIEIMNLFHYFLNPNEQSHDNIIDHHDLINLLIISEH